MLERELNYFIENQPALVSQYNGKYIVLVGDQVVGAYGEISEAYEAAIVNYEPGHFFIQHVAPGKEAYSQTFNSRVIFA